MAKPSNKDLGTFLHPNEPNWNRNPASNWFVAPRLSYWIAIVAGLSYMSVAYLAPAYIPTKSLGPLGWLTEYLVYDQPIILAVIFYGTIAIHCGEAAYAFYMARQLNLSIFTSLKWTLQTFIVGIASTFIIKAKRDSLKRDSLKNK